MRILITGISGMLGLELWDEFRNSEFEVFGLSRRKPELLPKERWLGCDIIDFKDTYLKVTKLNPDLIIHTAALSDVDECERDPETAFKVNAVGTRNIALAAQRFDSAVFYISTDYVFSGENHPENGYREFDTPAPINVYGVSKLWGEFYVRELLNKFCIIRTSWLFGRSRDNFITKILNKKEILVTEEMVSSPTYTKDLASAIKSLLSTFHTSHLVCPYGIYHITNSGFASRYEISRFVAELLGLGVSNIKKVKLSELKLSAKRPNFSALENFVWKLDGFKPLRSWQEAVKEFLKKHL